MPKYLYTRSILSDRVPGDGVRISVMSRHTANDGVTVDKRIVPGKSFDLWIKELAPPGKLVGCYLGGKVSWEDYKQLYIDYLRTERVARMISELAKRCTQETVTLLCIEEKATHCHRRILAEEIQRIQPALQIRHKELWIS